VFVLAAGVGAVAGLTLGSDGGSPEVAKPEQAGSGRVEANNAGQGHKPGDKSEGNTEGGASDAPRSAAYSNSVAGIQNGSMKASLWSNDKRLRYDQLTASTSKN
jgi:hypothetical protein